MLKANFEVHTSFISPWTWENLVEKGNNLPILAIRNISNSRVIGRFQDSSIHFKELAPSNELFREKRDGYISLQEFQRRYILELLDNVSFSKIVERFNQLYEISGASGVIIFGYGSNDEVCHRSVLAEVLNKTGFFRNRITEIIL